MTLQLIGGRDCIALTATPPASGTGWCSWLGVAAQWAQVGETAVKFPPGRYRIESPNGFSLYYLEPWEMVEETSDKNALIGNTSRPLQIFAGIDKAGTFFITRLA